MGNDNTWLYVLGEGRRQGSVGAQEGHLPQLGVTGVLGKFQLRQFFG